MTTGAGPAPPGGQLALGGRPVVNGGGRLAGLIYAYATLPPHDDETVTPAGQIGVSFSAHHSLRYRTGATSARGGHPAGSVVCSGVEPIVWSDVAEPTEAFEMSLDADLLERSAAIPQPGGWPIERAVVGRIDPVVVGVASAIRRAHVCGSSVSDIAGSTLAHLLARHVLSSYGGVAVPPTPDHPTTLDRRAVATVADVVESHLGEGVTLDRLAGAVHLSPFHFARAFKATVGLAPHAFVTSRRMDRARLLLRTSAEPVEAIAARLGYSNLSHFRRVFRAHTGGLPGAYRAATATAPATATATVTGTGLSR